MPPGRVPRMSVHDFHATTIDGREISLGDYAGKVLLIVNVASKCGFTPQYEGLEALYRAHRDQGLEILGFPCDQFGHQEPGTEEEIVEFCSTNYGVSFPMFSKIEVNGSDAHPLYKYMRAEQVGDALEDVPGGEHLAGILKERFPEAFAEADGIRWNFTKFLVSPSGEVVKRFQPVVTPETIGTELASMLA
jgi:glutathione peroxidase